MAPIGQERATQVGTRPVCLVFVFFGQH